MINKRDDNFIAAVMDGSYVHRDYYAYDFPEDYLHAWYDRTHPPATPVWRVYMAGKIAKNDWRHKFLDLSEDNGPIKRSDRDCQPHRTTHFMFGKRHLVYTGPWFVSDDHGSAHGPAKHGVGSLNAIATRKNVFSYCIRGIDLADTVLVWIGKDFHEAYGTHLEIGYAMANNKNIVYLVHPDMRHDRELWFYNEVKSSVVITDDPYEGFKEYLELLKDLTK